MPWGRLSDDFEGHPKRRRVSLAADGLLARAISRCARYLTDGWVEASWVRDQIPARQRTALIDEMVGEGLLEPFPAGTTRTVEAQRRRKVLRVTIGPFRHDGYLVHDYLDYNPARVEVEAERASNRDRQAGRRASSPPPPRHAVTTGVTNGESHDGSHSAPTQPSSFPR